jgi:hypothetical protein
MRRMSARTRRDEQGAVVVLMAAFVTVILAMAALVVDVGSVLDEKRQLQNGADAAALGVAQHMAKTCPTADTCTPASLRTASESLARLNARDGFTRVDAPTPDYSTKRVTVTTRTEDAAGRTILPYQIAQALAGGRKGQPVHATAAALWEPAGVERAKVVPLTISKCEFTYATSNNTVFGVQTEVRFRGSHHSCPGSPSGQDLPGGFGWLRDTDSDRDDCSITPSTGDTVAEDTGQAGTPHSCNLATLLNKDVYLALYDGFSGNGSNGSYHLYGFGQFRLTGFKFPTQSGGNNAPCTTNSCLIGSFVRFVATGDLGGPSNLGGFRVALVS